MPMTERSGPGSEDRLAGAAGDAVPRLAERRTLTNVAYRMLGTLSDAEDAVQEAYARWYRLSAAQRAEIETPIAWLVRTTSRICLDMLGSAHHRRENYSGDWLPEPVPTTELWRSDRAASAADDPADRVTLDESVSTALLVVLDTLTPAERVSYVLHDVFGLAFTEIAETTGRSPAACRQLATSARRRISDGASAGTVAPADASLVAAVEHAWHARDLDRLVALFAPDVVATTDSGGGVSAPAGPVHGAADVARLLIDVRRRRADVSVHATVVNGQPGLVARSGAATLAVIALAATRGRVSRLWIVRNPDKLAAWQ